MVSNTPKIILRNLEDNPYPLKMKTTKKIREKVYAINVESRVIIDRSIHLLQTRKERAKETTLGILEKPMLLGIEIMMPQVMKAQVIAMQRQLIVSWKINVKTRKIMYVIRNTLTLISCILLN